MASASLFGLIIGLNMNLKDFKEDTQKWQDGAPIKYHGAIFWVKRYNSPESNKFLANLRKKLHNPYENLSKEEIAEREQEVLGRWLCEFAVTKWRGVFDENEKELVCDKRNKYDLFCNPSYYYSVNEYLILRSMDFDNYLYTRIDEDIAAIKKRVEFDVEYPSDELKLSYLKRCNKAGVDPEIPKLNELQNDILSAFYSCDRERTNDEYIKQSDAKQFTDIIPLDDDISWRAIKSLDAHLIQLRAEKHARKKDSSKG